MIVKCRNIRRYTPIGAAGALIEVNVFDARGRTASASLDALAEVGLPLGVFDRNDLRLGIRLQGFAKAGDAARADTLLQRARAECDLASVATTVLQRLQHRYTGDAAQLDMILADDGPQVLEADAIPGLTDTSLLPMAAEGAGLEFEQLCARIVELALDRQGAQPGTSAATGVQP